MAGALMLLAEGLLRGSDARVAGPSTGTFELLYLGGWGCSLLGMWYSGATGRGRSGRVVLAIQGIGLSLAALFTIWEAWTAGRVTSSALYEVTNAAWPLSHLFMIVVGIATLRAGVWRGWTRFTPLLCGLALPVSILAGVIGIGGQGGGPFAILTAASFFLLGSAVAAGGAARVAGRPAVSAPAR